MANAMISFNSKVLSNLLESFAHQGKNQPILIIKRTSLFAWQDINLQGKYLFAEREYHS